MLEFTLTQADLAAFAAHQAQESGEEATRGRRFRLISAWLVGVAGYLVVVGLTAVPLLLNLQFGWAALGEAVALGFGYVLGLLDWRKGGLLTASLLARRYRLKAREALAATGAERRLTLDDDGFTVAAGTRSTRVPWTGVRRIAETSGHFFIYTGPSEAHVVPRRGREAETRSFVEAISEHL
ncbi:MAG TPA: YcxB family protein [Propionicimonas sp.]|uniref:YcxB family protein n=1 Tax=Propionicimonas sp. TaxID=1955623 RepID=UPI002F419AE9